MSPIRRPACEQGVVAFSGSWRSSAQPARCARVQGCLLGRPARFAFRLMVKAALGFGASSVALVSAAAVLLWCGPRATRGDGPLMSVLAVSAAGAAAGSVVAMSVFRRRWQRASTGRNAEVAVWRVLRRAGVCGVVGLVTQRGDIDVAVTSPGFAVVEVKHGRGPVQVTDSGELTVAGRPMKRDPLRQVRDQVALVEHRTGHRPDAMLCVSGMTNAPFTVHGVTVCPPAYLDGLLKDRNRVSPFTARQLQDMMSPGQAT